VAKRLRSGHRTDYFNFGKRRPTGERLAGRAAALYRGRRAMNENFSLVVMVIFLLLSLAFLAQQLTAYH
jgi:hypothetical protein